MNNESFLKGKVVKLEDIWDINTIEEIADPKFLRYYNTNYYYFTFYLEEFLEIFNNHNPDIWTADLILFKFIFYNEDHNFK